MPKAAVNRQPTKELRAKARKEIGKLKHQVIRSSTEDRYLEVFHRFLKFHRLQRSFVIASFEEFDELTSEYIEMLWETGEPKSVANYTLAALQFFRPQLKQRLPWSWKLVKVWNQVELPIRATPMSPQLLLAYAGLALKWKQPRFAWLILVGFGLFLRTGEMLTLKRSDISFGHDHAIIFVASSKGAKKKFLPLERLELREATPLWALRKLCENPGRTKDFFLWGESRRSFMSLWHDVTDNLKLSDCNYKPYSLRRGGASSAYRLGTSLDMLVSKGRWQHVHTARIYLDTGLQALATLTLPEASRPLVAKAAQHFASVSQLGTRGREAPRLGWA